MATVTESAQSAYSDTTVPPATPSVTNLTKLLADFPTTLVDSALKRVEEFGLEGAILYYLSQLNHQEQRLAGRLELAGIYQEAASSLREYLLLMRPLMRAYTTGLGSNTAPIVLDPTAVDFAIQLHQLYRASRQIIKLDAPNDTWLFLWIFQDQLEPHLVHQRDLRHDHHSMSVFRKSYLTKVSHEGRIIELPQFLHLRVAAQYYGDYRDPTTVATVLQAYHQMARFDYVPGSPHMFNAGLTLPQMSSCFLQSIEDDMSHILWTYLDTGLVSKNNGANGIGMSRLRTHSAIGNSGLSEGIKPVVKTLDNITGQVDQGRRRPGATQMTLAIWHQDVQDFIDMAPKFKSEADSVKNAHTSLYLNNLFMQRVVDNADWSLFCPTQVPELLRTHNEEFAKWYLYYEQQGLARAVVKAKTLLRKIAKVRISAGMPFLANADAINGKTNQSNIGLLDLNNDSPGIIETLNLCMEIALKSDSKRVPSCNLSSTCLPSFLKIVENSDGGDGSNGQNRSGKPANGHLKVPIVVFDWTSYAAAVRAQVRNLNKVIERNFYPLPEIEFANQESSPIGIGSQGFADLLAQLDIAFDSAEAAEWTEKLAACAYYNGLYESMLIARERGFPYRAFPGSPFSQGILQFDMWAEEDRRQGRVTPRVIEPAEWGQDGSWAELKELIKVHGVANSQITTSQPTASCAQLAGASEAWEPYFGMLFVRKVLSGEFITLNKYLQADLEELGLWNDRVVAYLRHLDGSVQGLHEIFPQATADQIERLKYLERKYQTAFEVSQKVILDHAAARGRYIDGSQSTSTYWLAPTETKLMAADLHAWKKGLKTMCYYTRSRAARNAVKFTLESTLAELYKPLEVQKVELNEYHGNHDEAKRASSERAGLDQADDIPDLDEAVKEVSDVSSPVLFCSRDNPSCTSCDSPEMPLSLSESSLAGK